MMRFKPTTEGGRIAEGDTPFGKYRAVWDAEGNLLSACMEIKDPPARPPRPAPTCLRCGAELTGSCRQACRACGLPKDCGG